MELADQCIIFDLPSGGGGMAAGMVKSAAIHKLREFSAKYNAEYKIKTETYRLKIWFQKDFHYSLFLLSYTSTNKIWKHPYVRDEKYYED